MNRRKKILIVDDTLDNIQLLISLLSQEDYEIHIAKNGVEALEILTEILPDLILLDINMPLKNGYEVCEEIKSSPATKHIPVIFLTALNDQEDERKGLELGAVDFITKPFSPEIVKVRVKNHLQLKEYQDNLEELVRKKTQETKSMQLLTIDALAILAEYRDNETGAHIRRTKNYVKLLAQKLQNHPKFRKYLTPQCIEMLYNSAPLHDIGKVAISDNILLKPGKLTDEEMEVMKQHTSYGHEALVEAEKNALLQTSFLNLAKEITYTHHEKYDGSGYPRGLKGDTIPISGRLMAIADVYDALISRRVYKPPFSHSKAVGIIESERGSAFDPDIVDAFVEIQEKFREVALQNVESQEEREALLQ